MALLVRQEGHTEPMDEIHDLSWAGWELGVVGDLAGRCRSGWLGGWVEVRTVSTQRRKILGRIQSPT